MLKEKYEKTKGCNMKKILFFFSGIYNGGTEIEVYNLLSRLNKEKYDLYFSYSDIKNSDEIMVNRIKQYAKFIDINFQFHVNTIIYCTEALDEISIIENNIKYEKSYYWFHYFWEDQEEFLQKVINENKVDKVIAVSETSKNKLIKFDCLKGKEQKVSVIYNVLDVEKIKRISNEEIDIPLSNGLNLVTVARIAPIKRFDRIDKIATELEKQNINYKWMIVGKVNENEYSEYAKEIKNKLVQHSNIIFVGEQINPFKYMKKSDYSMVLSDAETCSLVITESKIVGTPCVVTDFDAAFEQIEDGKNGIILRRNNEDYEQLVKNMVMKKEILHENLKTFNYDLENIMNKWDSIL